MVSSFIRFFRSPSQKFEDKIHPKTFVKASKIIKAEANKIKTEAKKIAASVSDNFDLLGSILLVEDIKECNVLKEKFYTKLKGKDPSDPEAVNEAMQAIGGEPLLLHTAQKCNLKGMTFTADDFFKAMQNAGTQRVTISNKIPAFVLDENHSFLETLKQMGFLRNTVIDSETQAEKVISQGIWDSISMDGKVYLFNKEESQSVPVSFGRIDRSLISEPTEMTYEKEDRKTIVLNGGIFSRFESNKTAQEVAKFISLGFNVVVSEDKHDQKVNSESKENVMANRDALFEHLKSQGIENKNIIWKGTCFSSIPAAASAAKYRETHAIIDQGYAKGVDVVSEQVTSLFSFVAKPFVKALCHLMDFNYDMGSNLDEITGNIAIIRNTNDGVIPEWQHTLMKKTVGNKSNTKFFTINDDTVRHADLWFSDRTCDVEFSNYLISKKMTSGKLLK